MAALDGNYGGRDNAHTYTLINFVRKIRASYNNKIEQAQINPYTRFPDGSNEYSEVAAKNYAMVNAGMILNMMNRGEQESMRSCFGNLQ